MVKTKTYKLIRTPKNYSPIIAILGRKSNQNLNKMNNKSVLNGPIRIKKFKNIFKRTMWLIQRRKR